jgi:large subunit ribosomal protein L18e
MIANKEKENLQMFLEKVKVSGKGTKEAELRTKVYDIASRPKRRRVAVNLSKLEKCARENESVLVPGKVLGAGSIGKKISVCAVEFSDQALEKLKAAGCSIVSVEEILKKDKVRLIV